MKILIVSAWYSPAIHPRAYRWTGIAAHWSSLGHQVTVLTSQHTGTKAGEIQENGVKVIRTGHSALHEVILHALGLKSARGNIGVMPKRPSGFTHFWAWCYRWFWKYWIFPDDAVVWYFPAQKKIFQLIDSEDFDLFITVSMPFTGHWLGMSAKQRYGSRLPVWLADIGDPFSFSESSKSHPFWHNIISRTWEHRLLLQADHIAVTTSALQKRYSEAFDGLDTGKIKVIPPLYIPFGKKEKKKQHRDGQKVAIGYFGTLYYPIRPPEPFLAFVQALQKKHPKLYQSLEFHFFGDLIPEVWSKIRRIPNVYGHGLYHREEAAVQMQRMDILLNIGNLSSIQLPSKSVDYMASGKPILHLSLVEDDPFIDFFEQYPSFFSMLMPERVECDPFQIDTVANWILSPKHTLDADELNAQLAPHRLEAISAAYLTHHHIC